MILVRTCDVVGKFCEHGFVLVLSQGTHFAACLVSSITSDVRALLQLLSGPRPRSQHIYGKSSGEGAER
jgi:hypothetical protein